MKISEDQNTVTLENGKELKAVRAQFNCCSRCYFENDRQNCWFTTCESYIRNDHYSVFFEEVKNEN